MDLEQQYWLDDCMVDDMEPVIVPTQQDSMQHRVTVAPSGYCWMLHMKVGSEPVQTGT